ncbi:MAG: tetratricopeptide repeat protein [Rhodobacterales bacterium]|nr:tetratricopeptide repeat protein [Rhodobacterales bacterium]
MSEPVPDENFDRLLELADHALENADPLTALDLCQQILEAAPAHAGALFLLAESLRTLGDSQNAEVYYRRVLALTPEPSPSWSAIAWLQFETLRFSEARNTINRGLRLDPTNAEAYYVRAMLRERRLDHVGALRDYTRAHRHGLEAFPMPVRLDDASVTAVVEEALSALHPSIQEYLLQVAILLEDVPAVDLLREYAPPAPPAEILGYFAGVSLAERSIENPWSNLPSAIVLFRCNLQRIASDRERMVEELRITVFHEVGHFLGLDEEDLKSRGLD